MKETEKKSVKYAANERIIQRFFEFSCKQKAQQAHQEPRLIKQASEQQRFDRDIDAHTHVQKRVVYMYDEDLLKTMYTTPARTR